MVGYILHKLAVCFSARRVNREGGCYHYHYHYNYSCRVQGFLGVALKSIGEKQNKR